MKGSKYIAAAIFAGLGGGAVAVAAGGNSGESNPVPNQSSVEVHAVDHAIASSFAVFRSSGNSEKMPTEVAAEVASPDRYGRNADLARGLETINGPGWIIPGNQSLCLAVPDPIDGYGMSCVSSDWASKFGVFVVMVSGDRPAEARVTMLVPDGAEVQASRGISRSTDIGPDVDGVVNVLAEAGSSIRITAADGESTVIQLPEEALTTALPGR